MAVALTALIAGHRPDRLPAGEVGERLFFELDRLLTLLQDVAGHQDAALRVLTGTAEGTDEETARIAERIEVPLHLLALGQPVPLTVSQQLAERTVWLGAVDDALHSHEVIAIRDEIALPFADLLVVVWDGQSPQGLSGGTVRLAFQAALMMKPVIWMHTDGTVRMLDRTRLAASYLHKLRCPHPEPSWLHDCFTTPLDEPALRHQLAEAVKLILDPSMAASDQDKERLKDYRTEASKAGEDPPPVPTRLIEARFERADIEATVAAGRYRAITWMLYGASAMAVFSAVAGAIELWPGSHGAFWPVVELALIAGIVGGFMLAKTRCWHEKWLGHRFIAEQLRYAQMCLPLLGHPRPFAAPAWQIEKDTLHLASAELWFIQRTLTMEGLPEQRRHGFYREFRGGQSPARRLCCQGSEGAAKLPPQKASQTARRTQAHALVVAGAFRRHGTGGARAFCDPRKLAVDLHGVFSCACSSRAWLGDHTRDHTNIRTVCSGRIRTRGYWFRN